MIKWELDLWNELWDRAGSQGLDTWHDLSAAPSAEKNTVTGPATETGVPPGAGGASPDDGGRTRR